MRRFFLFVSLFWLVGGAKAQQPPFYNDIQAFKHQDSLNFPAKHSILFVGSSSFTKWTDVQDYFPGFPILNRGFGGSSLPDVIRYAPDIIFPYEPKQVVIYCGENDFAIPGSVPVNVVVERVRQLVEMIRNRFPKIPIDYISIKPSPSRKHLWPAMVEANKQIKKMLKKKKNMHFINVYDGMMNPDGTVKAEIFLGDDLHMNAKGYAIWQRIIAPYLVK